MILGAWPRWRRAGLAGLEVAAGVTHVRFEDPVPFQPTSMSTAQLAAVSYLARYSGHTHELYAYQLRRWFAWCQDRQLDPLVAIAPVLDPMWLSSREGTATSS